MGLPPSHPSHNAKAPQEYSISVALVKQFVMLLFANQVLPRLLSQLEHARSIKVVVLDHHFK